MNKLQDLQDWGIIELLQADSVIIGELKNRKILRSSNNPVADYTEWLVSNKLALKLQGNSSAGYDAIDSKGNRVQLKGRRVASGNRLVQLSSLRNLPDKPFDYLIGVIYREDYSIEYVAQVPYEVVLEKAKYRKHTNSYTFYLHKAIFQNEKVVDLTKLFVDADA